jgi:hypothetical protein
MQEMPAEQSWTMPSIETERANRTLEFLSPESRKIIHYERTTDSSQAEKQNQVHIATHCDGTTTAANLDEFHM